jgi:hypothetical protein
MTSLGRDERVAKRVRVLHIQPLVIEEDEIADWEDQLIQAFAEDTRKRIPDTVELDFDWSNPVQELERCITSAVALMPNVANCSWVFLDYSPSVKLPSNFSGNWPSFSNNLEVLELLNPVTDAACGLQSAQFPCLRDLTIAVADWDIRMEGIGEPPTFDILASFISRLNPTLQRLSIQAEWPAVRWFDKLGHFPQLISLELSMFVLLDELNDGAIARFITKHAATLEYLSFGNSLFHPRFQFMEDEFEAVELTRQNILRVFSFMTLPFPRLRKLELDLEHTECGMSLATCIRPFVNTLTTLILKKNLSTDDLDVVSDAIARKPGVLTSVSLDLECLSPRSVDLLAERLPNIADLTLTVEGIKGVSMTSNRYSDVGCLHS